MWLLKSFRRRKTEAPSNTASIEDAVRVMQTEVIKAAEQKLARPLTEPECRGIRSVRSLMMLESCERAFSSPMSSQAEVLGDLAHFAKKAQ